MNSETKILAEASKEENLTMKKLLSLLLCLILCLSLFACNSEEAETTKKATQASEEKSTLPNNENNKNETVSAEIDYNVIQKMVINSNGVENLFNEDTEAIKKVVSYVNGLKLQNTDKKPPEDPEIIISFIKIGSVSTTNNKRIFVYLFESGKKVGISDALERVGHGIVWEDIYWYDVVDDDATKPLDFLEEFFESHPKYYFPIAVKDARLFIPDKEIDHIEVSKYTQERLNFSEDSDIENIVKTIKNMKLYEAGDDIELWADSGVHIFLETTLMPHFLSYLKAYIYERM